MGQTTSLRVLRFLKCLFQTMKQKGCCLEAFSLSSFVNTTVESPGMDMNVSGLETVAALTDVVIVFFLDAHAESAFFFMRYMQAQALKKEDMSISVKV